MKVRCVCGNIFYINWNNWSSGKRCGCKTFGANRLKVEEIKKEVEELGYIFVSHKFEDNKHIITCICQCGKERTSSLETLRNGTGKCQNCFGSMFAFTYEYVKQYFEDQGAELLEKEYVNARKKMKYRCSCGRIAEICFYSFKNLGNRCRACGSKRSADKQRLSHEYVFEYFKSQSCELLDQYIDAKTLMNFKCSCGNLGKCSWNSFFYGTRCKECGQKRLIISRSGTNNYQWIPDREKKKENDDFKQRCYKMLRIALTCSGQRKTCRTEQMLGYSIKNFQSYIKNHSNWKNVEGKRWHVDHIFPIKAFVDYGIKDIQVINCLENLQPLLYNENISKSGKYDPQEFEKWLISKGVNFSSKVA